MSEIDQEKCKVTLDSLRAVRKKLYSMSEKELNSMTEEDQTLYADDLNNIGVAILKLESAKLKDVNDAFKAKEEELKTAAKSLENSLAGLNDAVKVIRAASEGMTLVSNIVQLLG